MNPRRPLFAIGDVHGDADRLVTLLTVHKLVTVADDRVQWATTDTIVLLMGDVLDAASRMSEFGDMAFQGSVSDLWILELLAVLRDTASAHGNTILCIMGNHEVMNLRGRYEYVSPHHMPQRSERDRYFSTGGRGREIIESMFQTSIVYNGNLYSHAGIPVDASPGVSRLVGVKTRGKFMDLLGSDDLATLTSHREYLKPSSPSYNFQIARMCRRRGVNRLVIGHNVVSGTPVARYDGRVVYTDTGLSRAFTVDASPTTFDVVVDPGNGELVVRAPNGSSRAIPTLEE